MRNICTHFYNGQSTGGCPECNKQYKYSASAATENPFKFLTEDKKMSEQKQAENMIDGSKIITGLRLSEAIRYCEENDKVLIKPDEHAGYASHYEFAPPDRFQMITSYTWTVKLPPPKTVSVTKEQLTKAFERANAYLPESPNFVFEQLCKELGL